MSVSPWWAPESHADRRPALLLRGADQGGSCAPVSRPRASPRSNAGLWPSRPAMRPICMPSPPKPSGRTGRAGPLYLHTSPEFAAKKLLAAGETKIFDFARVFRNRERGPLHAPEFTMLEWYRADEPYEAVMADSLALLRLAAERRARRRFSFRGRNCDPLAEAERLTVADAFSPPCRHRSAGDAVGQRRGRIAMPRHTGAARRLRCGRERQLGRHLQQGPGGAGRTASGPRTPDDPLRISALRSGAGAAAPHDPRLAERFELYACGVELANGFGELTDPAEQRARFEAEMDEKAARLWRALSARRGFPRRACAHAASNRASRSASTGW